mgnify:CR=1 FL=1
MLFRSAAEIGIARQPDLLTPARVCKEVLTVRIACFPRSLGERLLAGAGGAALAAGGLERASGREEGGRRRLAGTVGAAELKGLNVGALVIRKEVRSSASSSGLVLLLLTDDGAAWRVGSRLERVGADGGGGLEAIAVDC